MTQRDVDLAWAAGIIEGEGSISIYQLRRKGRGNIGVALKVAVTMTDRQCIDMLHAILGGWVGNHHLNPDGKHRRSYIWHSASQQAGACLRELLPYLRSDRMRAKAELAIRFQDQKRIGVARYIEGYQDQQMEYHERMRILNLRGAEAIARDLEMAA